MQSTVLQRLSAYSYGIVTVIENPTCIIEKRCKTCRITTAFKSLTKRAIIRSRLYQMKKTSAEFYVEYALRWNGRRHPGKSRCRSNMEKIENVPKLQGAADDCSRRTCSSFYCIKKCPRSISSRTHNARFVQLVLSLAQPRTSTSTTW